MSVLGDAIIRAGPIPTTKVDRTDCSPTLTLGKLWGHGMPIWPFLAGRAFEPERITEMSTALEGACGALGYPMVDNTMTRLIAEKIIELSQRGVHGAERLQSMALSELNAPPS